MFINLLRNENMKIFYRPGTWVMFAILFMLVLLTGLFTKFLMVEEVQENWQASLEINNMEMQQMLEDPSLPIGAREHYERELALNEYRLEHDIMPIDTNSFWGFVSGTANLTSAVTMFTIVVAAGIVAGEFSWGTIKLLLIRPVSRWKVLLSKYIATFFFALLMLVALFIFAISIGAVLFGFSTFTTPFLHVIDGVVSQKSMVSQVFMLYGLNSVELLMMVTFAFMISTVFRNSSLAIGLALFLMFTGTQLVHVLSQYSWVKYILFANTYLAQYFDGGTPIVEGMTLPFSIVMLVIYFVLFNALSWFIFQKRDVAA